MTNYREPFKDEYLQTISTVTNLIKANEAKKVVIARSLEMEFQDTISSPQVLSHVVNEQPESYLFGLEHEDLLFFGASLND